MLSQFVLLWLPEELPCTIHTLMTGSHWDPPSWREGAWLSWFGLHRSRSSFPYSWLQSNIPEILILHWWVFSLCRPFLIPFNMDLVIWSMKKGSEEVVVRKQRWGFDRRKTKQSGIASGSSSSFGFWKQVIWKIIWKTRKFYLLKRDIFLIT